MLLQQFYAYAIHTLTVHDGTTVARWWTCFVGEKKSLKMRVE